MTCLASLAVAELIARPLKGLVHAQSGVMTRDTKYIGLDIRLRRATFDDIVEAHCCVSTRGSSSADN